MTVSVNTGKKLGTFRAVVNSLKSAVGVGIFSIPFMLVSAGPTYGAALLTLIVCTSCFCVQQLVACRHTLEAGGGTVVAPTPHPAAVGLLDAAQGSGSDSDSDDGNGPPISDGAVSTIVVRSTSSSSPAAASSSRGAVRGKAAARVVSATDDDDGDDDHDHRAGNAHGNNSRSGSGDDEEDDHDDEGGRYSYPNLALRTLGPGGKWATIVTLFLAMYGSNISYLIFMKQNLPALVPELEPVARWIPAMAFLPLCLFLLLRDMRLLFYINAVAMLFVVTAAVLVGTAAVPQFNVKTVGLLLEWPDATAASNMGRPPKVTPQTVAEAFGIGAFAMEGLIALAMENYDSLRAPRRNFSLMLWTSMVLFTTLYTVFGVLACVAFLHQPQGIQESVLQNFPKGDTFWQVVGLLCVGQVFLTYPLVIVVPRKITEKMLWRCVGVEGDGSGKLLVRRMAVRVGLIALTCVIATVVADFAKFLGLLGCIVNSTSIFVLPNLMYLKAVSGFNCRSVRAVASFVIIIVGMGLAVVSAYSIIA